ncbi:MAG: glutamate--cysteine ligase [Coxiellaceae bacterium]|nr:glutamate--cysteine ligase [Coxiellaceae bacterium]
MITDNVQIPHVNTQLSGPLIELEKQLIDQQVKIESWLRQQWQLTPPSLYGSVDLRNAGFKLAPVDTNIFPAGFNNLNRDFLPLCIQAAQATIAEICPDVTRLLLIPESHTRNQMYFESIATLYEILTKAGFEVRIGSVNPDIAEATDISTPSGKTLRLEPLIREQGKVGVKEFFPCCIVLNNDLSDGIPPELTGLTEQSIMPCTELGWFARLKSEHFGFYEQVCHEFSQQLSIDPWLISPLFDYCNELDFMKHQGEGCLARRAEKLLYQIQQKYDQYDIKEKPYLVVKSNSGTYGMGVMIVQEAEQLLNLNRKQRTKMSASKGSNAVTSAILQEGVYSFETWGDDKSVTEPVIYMIGRHVVGGFYRVHNGRGPNESLNAPGMNFEPLAFADVCNNPCSNPASLRFYVYGVIARLANLAAAREMDAIKKEVKPHEH